MVVVVVAMIISRLIFGGAEGITLGSKEKGITWRKGKRATKVKTKDLVRIKMT